MEALTHDPGHGAAPRVPGRITILALDAGCDAFEAKGVVPPVERHAASEPVWLRLGSATIRLLDGAMPDPAPRTRRERMR